MNSSLLYLESPKILDNQKIKIFKDSVRGFAKRWESSPVFEIKGQTNSRKKFGLSIAFEALKGPKEILHSLQQLEKTIEVRIVLLAVQQTVRLDPECSLPHPSLSEDDVVLAISAELMPQYFHPITQMTLSEMCGKRKLKASISFSDKGLTF